MESDLKSLQDIESCNTKLLEIEQIVQNYKLLHKLSNSNYSPEIDLSSDDKVTITESTLTQIKQDIWNIYNKFTTPPVES